MSEPDWIARITAIAALLVSLATTIWNIKKDLSDRAKVKIEVFAVENDQETDLIHSEVGYTITNTGKRTCILTSIIIEDASDMIEYHEESFPKKLESGEQHRGKFVDYEPIMMAYLKSITVVDSIGQRWQPSKENIDKLKIFFENKQKTRRKKSIAEKTKHRLIE
jgi:hypothetical protein